METIKNEMVKAEINGSSLAMCKGYGYTNKEGKQRYSCEEEYFLDNGQYYRKHSNEYGFNYYKVDLIDVVIETFPMKDGSMGSKTYPVSEVPYLSGADQTTLENYLSFKLHR